MFSSISQATPLTVVKTSFTADRNFSLKIITSGLTIKVNGVVKVTGANSANWVGSILQNDLVEAELTSPTLNLDYKFYFYEIDSVPQSFAVINKSFYSVTVKPYYARQIWFLLPSNDNPVYIKYFSGTYNQLPLASTSGAIAMDNHVVLDPLTNGAYFYSPVGAHTNTIIFSGMPVDYVKIPSENIFLIACDDGKIYEIDINGIASLKTVLFSAANLNSYQIFSNPVITCLAVQDGFLYVGGDGYVWKIDLNSFTISGSYYINQYVNSIAPVPNSQEVLITTQDNQLLRVDQNGSTSLLLQFSGIGQLVQYNSKIYIPDGNNSQILIYNAATQLFESPIATEEFSPRYTKVFDGKLIVTGNDSPFVFEIGQTNNIIKHKFLDKVTLASMSNGNIIVNCWLKQYFILDARDLYRIVDVVFDSREGPISHIGTNSFSIVTLGSDELTARTPPKTYLWVNGIRSESITPRGALLFNGDYISLNKECRVAGKQRTNCIIGDTAYDYDVVAHAQTYYPRFIDFSIQTPATTNIDTRVFTLSNRLEPCHMSLEYGDLFVNNGLYLGNNLVYPEDDVEIRIVTNRPGAPPNNVLPVLTIGQRQFTIPISTNSINTITAQTFQLLNQNQNVTTTQTVQITGIPSLYDYYIPNLYDVSVKKNNVDITGNYLQQFGKNDILSVTIQSSPKRYDKIEIYLLGPTNYKFLVENIQPVVMLYINFGKEVGPYTRNFIPYYNKNALIDFRSKLQYFTFDVGIPPWQLTSPTRTIFHTGGIQKANLSISDPFARLIYNGEEVTTAYLEADSGATLAVARNAMSYYEGNITVYQHELDPDFDVYVDIPVANYDIVNQVVSPPTEVTSISYGTIEFNSVVFDEKYNKTVKKINGEKLFTEVRKILSFDEARLISDFPITTGFETINLKTGILNIDKNIISKHVSSYDKKILDAAVESIDSNLPYGRKFHFKKPESTINLSRMHYAKIISLHRRILSYKEFLYRTNIAETGLNGKHFYLPLSLSYTMSTINEFEKYKSLNRTLDQSREDRYTVQYVTSFNQFESQKSNDKKSTPAEPKKNLSLLRKIRSSREERLIFNFQTKINEFNLFQSIDVRSTINKFSTFRINDRKIKANKAEFTDWTKEQYIENFTIPELTITDFNKTYKSSTIEESKINLLASNKSSFVHDKIFFINNKSHTPTVNIQSNDVYKSATLELKIDPLIQRIFYVAAKEKINNQINKFPTIEIYDKDSYTLRFFDTEIKGKDFHSVKSFELDLYRDRYSPIQNIQYTHDSFFEKSNRFSDTEINDVNFYQPANLNYINESTKINLLYQFDKINDSTKNLILSRTVRSHETKSYAEHNVVYDINFNKNYYPTLMQLEELDPTITRSRTSMEFYNISYRDIETNYKKDSLFDVTNNFVESQKINLVGKEVRINPLEKFSPAETNTNQFFIEINNGREPTKINEFPIKDTMAVSINNDIHISHTTPSYYGNDININIEDDLNIATSRMKRDDNLDSLGTSFISHPIMYAGSPSIFYQPKYSNEIANNNIMIRGSYRGLSSDNYRLARSLIEGEEPIGYVIDRTLPEQELADRFPVTKTLPQLEKSDLLNTAITIPLQERPDLLKIARTLPLQEKSDLLNVSRTIHALDSLGLKTIVPTQPIKVEPDMLNLSITGPKLEEPDRSNTVNINLEVDPVPPTTLLKINIPVLDAEVLWKNELDPPDYLYGIFLTEQDAIAAAMQYSEYNPYRILDTDFWTFRVIFDTNLTCTIPRGRYPIAWLIRGG